MLPTGVAINGVVELRAQLAARPDVFARTVTESVPLSTLTADREETASDGTAQLRFAVRDSGIGIAPEDQERIFEEFTQVDRGPSRRLDGTGLDARGGVIPVYGKA